MNTETILSFLDKIFQLIHNVGIDTTNLTLDHIAYQASSSADYEKIKAEWTQKYELAGENIVGGRRVLNIKLDEPFKYKTFRFKFVELIEPKPEQVLPSDWEHIEMTVDCSLESFMKRYPNLDWNIKALDREDFPMITLKLDDNLQVKFPRNGVLHEIKKDKDKH